MSGIQPESTASSFLTSSITYAGAQPLYAPIGQITRAGATVACTTEGAITLTTQESITAIANTNIGLFTSSGDITISAGGVVNVYSTPSGFSAGQTLPDDPDGEVNTGILRTQYIFALQSGELNIGGLNSVNIKAPTLTLNELPFNACSFAGTAYLDVPLDPPQPIPTYYIQLPDTPVITITAAVSASIVGPAIINLDNNVSILRIIPIPSDVTTDGFQYLAVQLSNELSANIEISWNVFLTETIPTQATLTSPIAPGRSINPRTSPGLSINPST